MNLLLIDDEEDAVVDHIAALRDAKHRVDWVSTLHEAVKLLRESFDASSVKRYDMVMIDLRLDSAESIPHELKGYYDGLHPGRENEGQALGQWLWEKAGARVFADRPMHFYFTNLPQFYRRHREESKQEFGPLLLPTPHAPGQPWLILKWDVVPSKFAAKLQDIEQAWSQFRVYK